jgi:proton glutamate symport protein
MIKTIIAPLLFSTLVVGIAGHANIKQIGRMGWKSLLYFEIVSALALIIGLLATLYVALFGFLGFVLLPVALIFRIPVKPFIKAVSEPATIAFATSNSESALPSAMESMEKFGIPRKIVAFVIPTGYSFNLDGTTLYLSLASIFVAQAAGIDLPLEKQIIICVTLMLTSKGVAGVSRAALVILLGTVVSFGLPVEPVFIILGIDVLMDMARTSVNVIGNCLATAVIARSENEFDEVAARNFKPE